MQSCEANYDTNYRNVNRLTLKLVESLSEREDILIQHHPLVHENGTYDFLRIASKEIEPEDSVIIIRATVHGDEIAGFYTMLFHLNEIIDYAHRAGIKVIVYPLGNPSGFENNTRYNADSDRDEYILNNNFLTYELDDGNFTGDLAGRNDFKKWYWASDPKLNIHLAAETALMHELLKQDPLSQVVAVVDLHQDYFTKGVGPATYQYTNEHPEVYQHIVDKIHELLPALANTEIDAGYDTSMTSDDNGNIIRRDGTLPDLLYHLGCTHGITPETTGATPLKLACQVNLIWIKGIIDLVAKETKPIPEDA